MLQSGDREINFFKKKPTKVRYGDNYIKKVIIYEFL